MSDEFIRSIDERVRKMELTQARQDEKMSSLAKIVETNSHAVAEAVRNLRRSDEDQIKQMGKMSTDLEIIKRIAVWAVGVMTVVVGSGLCWWFFRA